MTQPEPPREEDLESVLGPDFSVVLRGYDRSQVDGLLKQAYQALLAGRPDLCAAAARELAKPILVRLRGYDRVQVDGHVRRLISALTDRPPGPPS